MTLEELLVKAGLATEQVKQVTAKSKEENVKILVDTGGDTPQYIPKSRLDEEIEKKKLIKGQLDNVNTTVKDLEKSLKGNENFEAQLKTLEESNKDLAGKYETSVKRSALKIEALKENAKDPEDIVKFADLSKLTLAEDGSVVGADSVVKNLKEAKAYWFNEEKAGGGTGDPGNPAGSTKKADEDSIGNKLSEYNKKANQDVKETRENFFK